MKSKDEPMDGEFVNFILVRESTDGFDRKYKDYNHKRIENIRLRCYCIKQPNKTDPKWWYNIMTKSRCPTIPELNVYGYSTNQRRPDSISDEEFSLYILKYLST